MKEKMIGLWHFVKGTIGLVLSILIVMSLFGVLDKEEGAEQAEEVKESDDTAAAVESAAVNPNNKDIDAGPQNDSDNITYLHVGGKYGLHNGGSMEILDAGYGYGVVYVLVELTSGDDEAMQFDQSDATLYIDDYEAPIGGGEEAAIDNGYIYVSGDTSYPTQASVNAGGRKASMVFVADIPNNISETAEVEFEIAGGIFKINPLTTGQAQQNLNEAWGITDEEEDQAIPDNSSSESSAPFENGWSGIIYGAYSLSPNVIGGHNEADTGWNSDETGGDYIYIRVYDENGEPVSYYSGISTEIGTSRVFTDGNNNSYQITSTDGGIIVDTITGDADEFVGFYQLDQVLDLHGVS